MFTDTNVKETNNPSEICAAVSTRAQRKAAGAAKTAIHPPSAPIASSAASGCPQTNAASPRAGNTNTDDGHKEVVTQTTPAIVGSPYPDTAGGLSYTIPCTPYPGTNPSHHEAIDTIVEYYRLRQDMIRARTKLILQAQASLRRAFDGDKEMAAKTYAEAAKDPNHAYAGQIAPYLAALALLDRQQAEYEKAMLRAMKPLPILQWTRSVKGFGDQSLANIIGEASGYRNDDGTFYSVGDFRSVSALWKRMGLAVINGERQRRTSDNWAEMGYDPKRRSVMWNIGNSLILSMGKFRPRYGEDVDANPEYTELQKVFANRARYEQAKLGKEVVESKAGKDSYCAHAAARAKRYVEKRLLRMLYAEWRRCMA